MTANDQSINEQNHYWPIVNGPNDCFFAALAAYMYFSIDGDDCSNKIADIMTRYAKGPKIEDIKLQLKELEILANLSEIAFEKMETSPAECDSKIHECAADFKSIYNHNGRKYNRNSYIDADVLGEIVNYSYYNGNIMGYYSKNQDYILDQLYLQLVHSFNHFYCLVIYDGLCYKIDSLSSKIIIRCIDEIDESEMIVLSTVYNRFDKQSDMDKYKDKYVTPIMNKVQRFVCMCY